MKAKTSNLSINQQSNSTASLNPSQKSQKINDKNQQYHYMRDERTEQQKQYQSKIAEEIYQHNMRLFRIELTSKMKVEYSTSKLFKIDVGNDWYAMITDNEQNAEYTVFTMHGAPGDHRQWAGLESEMNGSVRWINFIVPGFDGLDERRGNYSGSADDLSKLILMVLEERKVSRIIFCGHSMGSIFASYFITKYPQVVQGYINITGIVNYWYTGLLTFYRTAAVAYGFNRGPNHASMIRLLNKNQFREQHHRRFLADIKDVKFHDQVPFPELTVTQMCAYVKLITSMPKGCSQFYELNRKLKILRFLIFGKIDPLHEHSKTNEQIYSITRGDYRFDSYPQNSKLIAAMKTQLQATVFQIHNVKIEAQKLQQYFCYHFDETGHNAHKRRPKQISKILKIYVTVLKVMQKYKPLIESRL